MPKPGLLPLVGSLAAALLAVAAGCDTVPTHALRQSQYAAYQLHQKNQVLALERDGFNGAVQQLAVENRGLKHEVAKIDSDLRIANERLNNLASERGELQNRYVTLLKQVKDLPNPLSDDARRRFEELARKYPNFEFDPITGVSKFHDDILFDPGDDRIKPGAIPLLQEFAMVMNAGEAKRLNVLVVGHTDDKDIVRPETAHRSPTNWHLSTNRGNAVVTALSGFGVRGERLGVSGYSKFQPVAPNSNDRNRQVNRRVEIFVLAPDAAVAGWEKPGVERR